MSNGTCEDVDRPYGCKSVGCKWVFKKKFRLDGTIKKYKTTLVAKVIPRKKAKIILILFTSCSFDDYKSVWQPNMVFLLIKWTLRKFLEWRA